MQANALACVEIKTEISRCQPMAFGYNVNKRFPHKSIIYSAHSVVEIFTEI